MSAINLQILVPARKAWNDGRIVGQKRPQLPKHVGAIRVRRELADALRNPALFNLAVESKLRGGDPVWLKVADVFSAGAVRERASDLQSKTKSPVRFANTDGTRNSSRDGTVRLTSNCTRKWPVETLRITHRTKS
jgi:hypothetical protein